MSLSGALSDGAWKILNHLAKLKYPTPSTHGNPIGTRSYLVAHQRWADWQMRTIMRTMVDAGGMHHNNTHTYFRRASRCLVRRGVLCLLARHAAGVCLPQVCVSC